MCSLFFFPILQIWKINNSSVIKYLFYIALFNLEKFCYLLVGCVLCRDKDLSIYCIFKTLLNIKKSTKKFCLQGVYDPIGKEWRFMYILVNKNNK